MKSQRVNATVNTPQQGQEPETIGAEAQHGPDTSSMSPLDASALGATHGNAFLAEMILEPQAEDQPELGGATALTDGGFAGATPPELPGGSGGLAPQAREAAVAPADVPSVDAPASTGAGALTGSCGVALETGRTNLDAASQTQIGSILAEAEQQKAAIRGALNAARAQTDQLFGLAMSGVQGAAEEARGLIEQGFVAQQAAVDAAISAQLSQLAESAGSKRQGLTDLGEQLALQAEALGVSEGARVRASALTCQGQALAIGEQKVSAYSGYEKASDIAEMARQTSASVGEVFTTQGADAAAAATDKASSLAEKLRADARGYADNVGLGDDLQGTFEQLRADTLTQLEQARDQGLSTVDSLEQSALQELESARIGAQDRLTQSASAAEPSIDSAAESGVQSVEQATAGAHATLDDASAQISERVAESPPAARETLAPALDQLGAELGGMGEQLIAQIELVGEQVITGIGEGGAGTVTDINSAVEQLSGEVSVMQGELEGAIAAEAESSTSSMAEAAQAAIDSVNELGGEVEAELQAAFDEGETGLNDLFDEGSSELTSEIDATISGFEGEVSALGPKINEKAEEIENASFWDKLVRAVTAFARGFMQTLSALWDGLVSIWPYLVAALVIVLIVVLVVLASPKLLFLAGVFLALYGAKLLAGFMIATVILGVIGVVLATIREWDVLTDPNSTFEEKWEAVGRIGPEALFLVLDFMGTLKVLRGLGMLDELGKLRHLDDVAPPGAGQLDELGSGSGQLDELTDAHHVDDVVSGGSKVPEGFEDIKLHDGKQGKHVEGHNNYVPGKNRSILTADPEDLLSKRGTGEAIPGPKPPLPGSKERIEFAPQVVGYWVDGKTGEAFETTKAIIHYAKGGFAHIVPSRP